MPHVGEAYFTGSVPDSSSLGIGIRPVPEPNPGAYLNIRLTNGSAFYTAGGTNVSGGSVLTADQGAPNLLSSGWPVKLTDGSSVLGPSANPLWVTGALTVPAPTTLSGSVVGLLYGGVAAGQTNPFWVTGSVFVLNPSSGGAGGNVTALSGSVVGLLVGGQPVSQADPVPVSQQGTVTVTGTVALSRAVDVATLPNVTVQSGSVTGLLYGGVAASSQNPFWVTGSVGVTNSPSSVTTLSGSVSGLLVGGQPLAGNNPVPITGSVTLAAVSNVTVTNPQTTVTTVSGSVTSQLVGGVIVSNANPVPVSQQGTTTVTGSVSLTQGVAISNVVSVTGTVHMADVSAVTGTVALARAVDVATMPTVTITGSVEISQGVAVSNFPSVQTVTGTVHLADVSTITGSVSLTQGVAVSSLPSVSQGSPTGLGSAWPVTLVTGSNAKSDPLWVTGSVYVINQSAGGPASNVTTVSGSITALQVGGVEMSSTNPVWVTGSVFMLNPGGTSSNVTAQSGSVTGLLVGGVAVSNANPVPVTGTVHLADVSAVTGTVSLARAVDIATLPNVTIANPQTTVTTVSGSVTGLLVGGVEVSSTNPVWVTGSVFMLNPGGAGSNVTALSGSVVGLLYGGVAASSVNPIWITGSVADQAPTIQSGSVTGLLVGGVAVSNVNPVPINQLSGSITGLLVGGVALSNANPVPVTGTVSIASVSTITGSITLASVGTITGSVTLAAAPNVTVLSGSVSGLLVGGVAVSNANPVPASLVDGSNTVGAAYDISGQIMSGTTIRTVQYSFGTGSISGSDFRNHLVQPQGANNMIRVLSMDLVTSGPVNVNFCSTGSAGTVTQISSVKYLPASGGFVLPYSPMGWFQTKANEALNVQLSSTTTVGVDIVWIVVGP